MRSQVTGSTGHARYRQRRNEHGTHGRAASPSSLAVLVARRAASAVRRPARQPAAASASAGASESAAGRRSRRPLGEPSATPVPTPLPANDSEAKPGDILVRWYLLPRDRRPARAGRGRAQGRRRVQRLAPRHPPAVRGLRLRGRPRRPGRPARRRATARTSSARSASAAPNAFHGQWLDLQPLIDKNKFDMTPVPEVHRRPVQRRRRGPGRHPVRDLSVGALLQGGPVQGGRPERAAAPVGRRRTRCPTASSSRGTGTPSRRSPRC